ncbi:MAG: adenosylcobinamide-phosphate synthase CbiB [Actinomycetota bacterium]
MIGRAGAAVVGLLLDRVTGEPPDRFHPVAWFGTAMGRVERRLWADRRHRGVAHAATGVTIGWVAGALLRSTAVAVAISAAGRSLRATAAGVGQTLEADDLEGARHQLRALVGRDPSELDASGISAAVIESVAENSVDAVVAPVFWAVVAGAPGALAYRAVNTMDAMVGHRSDRYLRYGWAAARLDDVANYLPARLFAALVIAAGPGRTGEVVRLVRRDARAHPSPNAGVAETAMAASLGIELGGPLQYGDRQENRPRLGDGPRPGPADIGRGVAVADRAEKALAGALLLGALIALRSAGTGRAGPA